MGSVKILLLRGVNVSGTNRVPMAELRELLSDLGLHDVATYVQSGNSVFHDPGVAVLENKISSGIMKRFGFQPALFLLEINDYRAILESNPFQTEGAADGANVHIVFLAKPASGADLAGLRSHATAGEALMLTDRALYLHTPGGLGRSALAAKLPRYIKVEQTARNQRSAEAILALANAIAGG